MSQIALVDQNANDKAASDQSGATNALSVVVPTLNAANRLEACLTAVLAGRHAFDAFEIVVADGGSTDTTLVIARRNGVGVVDAPRGRGFQLKAGIVAARFPWLLVLHADTVLGAGWEQTAVRHMTDPRNIDRASYGRLALDDNAMMARVIEWGANIRSRLLALPYGDQGLLLSRFLYDAVGGFPGSPLMEDVALVDRIGRRRLVALEITALTDATRYRRGGWFRRPIYNLSCLTLYRLGMNPERIARRYER